MTGKFVLLAQLATFLAQIEAIIDALTGGDIKYTNAALNNGQETTVTAALNALFTDLATKASASDLSSLQSDVEALQSLVSEGSNPTAAIDKFNEIVAFLNGITNTETLEGIVGDIQTAIAAKYTKPSTGIPKTDLESAVQTSLGKADSALQESDFQFATDADILALFASGSGS